eukprot:bmy_05841T0
MKRHLSDMLTYGCTRLEIGVQSVYEDVARDTNRGHTVKAVCESFHLAKDSGFKVVAHMMPDLPNVGLERDIEQFTTAPGCLSPLFCRSKGAFSSIEFFENPAFRPDGLKLYPTLVIRGTGLYELWKSGRYKSYSPSDLIELVARILALVPPWTRVYRVQRMLSVDREDGNDRTARPSLFASITFIHMFISPFMSQEMEDDGKWAWCLVPGACDLHQRFLFQICSNPDTLKKFRSYKVTYLPTILTKPFLYFLVVKAHFHHPAKNCRDSSITVQKTLGGAEQRRHPHEGHREPQGPEHGEKGVLGEEVVVWFRLLQARCVRKAFSLRADLAPDVRAQQGKEDVSEGLYEIPLWDIILAYHQLKKRGFRENRSSKYNLYRKIYPCLTARMTYILQQLMFFSYRDIPMPLVSSGVEHGNLRELAFARMKDLGIQCRDVRTREVGIQEIHHKVRPYQVLVEEVELVRRDYVANGGWETFLSYEDPDQDILIGLLRLRKCSEETFRFELVGGVSIVRELHVYGSVVPVSSRDPTKFQHQGFGMLLMEEAERIAREEHGSGKIAVISVPQASLAPIYDYYVQNCAEPNRERLVLKHKETSCKQFGGIELAEALHLLSGKASNLYPVFLVLLCLGKMKFDDTDLRKLFPLFGSFPLTLPRTSDKWRSGRVKEGLLLWLTRSQPFLVPGKGQTDSELFFLNQTSEVSIIQNFKEGRFKVFFIMCFLAEASDTSRYADTGGTGFEFGTCCCSSHEHAVKSSCVSETCRSIRGRALADSSRLGEQTINRRDPSSYQIPGVDMIYQTKNTEKLDTDRGASKLYSGVGFIPLERKGCSNVEKQSFTAKSGVGTRNYYRKIGYRLQGPYMGKNVFSQLTFKEDTSIEQRGCAFLLFHPHNRQPPHSSMTGFCVPPCGSSPPSPSILHLLPAFQEVGKEQPACGLALPQQRRQHLRLGASPITQNAKLCVTERRWSVNVLSSRSEVTVPYLISPDGSYCFRSDSSTAQALQGRLSSCFRADLVCELLPDTARAAGPYNERQNGSSSRVYEEGAIQVGYPDSGRWTWILNLSSSRSG